MRILCFTNMYPTKNKPWAGSFVRELVEAIRATGTNVAVLAFDGRRRKSAYAEAVLQLRRTLRQEPFDLIHAHYGLTGVLAVSQRRVPVVVTFHGSDTRISWQARLSWLAARLATPVFVSRDGARRLGCPNADVIPAGVDLELFQPRPAAEARRSLGWSMRDRYVLLPGSRDKPAKGARLFDDVIAEIRRLEPDVTPVSLQGFSREEVVDVMNAVDVTLMTSTFEGSPVAIKESLACTTPVVSVPVGDVPQLLEGLPGCTIAPRDPTALAGAVLKAFECGGDTALRRRVEPLSSRRTAERTLALYEGVLAKTS
jgi:glycosyltransferase involved in cell wall biosynthesis